MKSASCMAQGLVNPLPPCVDEINITKQSALHTSNFYIRHQGDNGSCRVKIMIVKSITNEILTLSEVGTSNSPAGVDTLNKTIVLNFPKPLLLEAGDKIQIETERMAPTAVTCKGGVNVVIEHF